MNYGGIGAVIGHEIGHGFDDQGSKWDGAGNLAQLVDAGRPRRVRQARGELLAAQYIAFEPFPGFKVNGKFTLGENIGDLSGVTIAYAAYQRRSRGKPAGDRRADRRSAVLHGLGPGVARKYRDDEPEAGSSSIRIRRPIYRVNSTVRNVQGFYDAFGMKAGDKMYRDPTDRVTIGRPEP